jgi:hypothetical protein
MFDKGAGVLEAPYLLDDLHEMPWPYLNNSNHNSGGAARIWKFDL